jgi:hypothetical protein
MITTHEIGMQAPRVVDIKIPKEELVEQLGKKIRGSSSILLTISPYFS